MISSMIIYFCGFVLFFRLTLMKRLRGRGDRKGGIKA